VIFSIFHNSEIDFQRPNPLKQLVITALIPLRGVAYG